MPNPVLGILGGGQLGSLLATSAKKLNIKTIIFSDDENAPAKNFSDEFIFGNYNDEEKIRYFSDCVDVVTFEFENIPFNTLDQINNLKPVLPKPNINKIVQDRILEKNFINKLNINTTQYVSINKIDDLSINEDLFPGILKTSRFGYDGKGQLKINSNSEIKNLKIDFKNKYILEKLIKIKKEISVILTRFGPESFEIYEPIENIHEDQILKSSKIPSNISKNIIEKSKKWAKLIADDLNFIGTICVEYFIDKNDNLFVNEIAPRVHNSGHLTINSHNVSQFENHIRAVCKLEKIPTKKLYDAEMVNILGNNIENFRNRKYLDNEFFFDYLKTEIKPKRKMGHLTTLKIL